MTAPFHGARALRPLTPLERLGLLMATVPDHAFVCGATAAALHGMPLPAAQELTAILRPTIGVPLPKNRLRRPELVGRALRISEDDLTTVAGIRSTTLARAWADLAVVVDLPRLVAITDHLIARRGGRVRVDDLRRMHAKVGANRGAQARAAALDLCADGAESPRESEVRVILTLAGLPMPETNVEIFDGARFVARVDMLYRQHLIVIEYDGEYHQTDAQWRRDEARRARLRELGYRLVVVTAADLHDPADLVERVRRLLTV